MKQIIMANNKSSLAIIFLAFFLLHGSAYAQDNFDIFYECAPECQSGFGNTCIGCIIAGDGCPPGCLEFVYGPSLCNCIPERYYPRP
ncbi:hypothetical protein Leryth_008160 [Lithospermum erythrorhizon]|nr:hypothetical protein Leryth_008160 [Lithospermum erythrorhizon]